MRKHHITLLVTVIVIGAGALWAVTGMSAPTLAEWVINTVDRNQLLDEVQAIHKNNKDTRLY